MGSIEIEYEGPNDFVDQKLPALLKTLSEIRKSASAESDEEDSKGGPSAPAHGAHSVTTIARKLGASSGRDLMIAAALKLSLKEGTFSRKTLLGEMKTASTYYKGRYSQQMTKELQRACKAGALNHVGGTDYSMPDEKKTDLLAKLK